MTAETSKRNILVLANTGRAIRFIFYFLFFLMGGKEEGTEKKKGRKEEKKEKNREKDERTRCEEGFEKTKRVEKYLQTQLWPVIKSISRAGFSRMYMRKASDDQRPRAWMRAGGVPFSARKVAPPARMD